MYLFLQEVIVGLANGAIYALIALGYTMVYGIIELINFAHGDIFMIGTFVSISVLGLIGITVGTQPVGGTLIGAMVVTGLFCILVCAVLGVVIERVAYRPLRNAPRLAPLISAIGVSLVLQNVGILWKGVNFVSFPQFYFFTGSVHLGPAGSGVDIKAVNILVIVLAVILMVGLQWMVTRTRIGRAMRAVAQDREAAALMGVNVDRIIAITFFIGAGLAGAAGFLYGLQFPSTIFVVGFTTGLFAFTAAVLGGIGNLVGAMLGGVLIGIIEALASLIPDTTDAAYQGIFGLRIGLPHGGSAWHEAVIFAVLILILVFRPSGLLGQQVPEKV
ncbi:MAG: branched-chain amino acid ABC transporter permease [Chloroflexi bacterium]|nr:MAG: branched-chain amino acid ABC transporter permease [Chloroflexota bacterium]